MNQRRVGGPLKQLYYKWGLAAIRKRLAYQYFRAESCFSSCKTFQEQLKQKIILVSSDNCGLLYQQGRRHSLLPNVCFDVVNSGMVQCQGDPYQTQTYSMESQCDSRFPIQVGQGHSDRMVSAPSGFSRKTICHQLECQTANLRIFLPQTTRLGR